MKDLKLHYDMTDADYFGYPAASNSLLSKLKTSPAHLMEAINNPAPPTPAMRLGSAFHVATLEADKFEKHWARGSELKGTTKEGKAAKKELAMQFSPDKILKPADYDIVCRMRDAVLRHPVASELLEGAKTEVAALWTDEDSGISCKAKIDALPGDDGYLVDLKSTIDASPEHMAKAISNFGYYRQAGHYLSPFETRDQFYMICCEKKPPYAVAVYLVGDASVRQGQFEVQALLHQWAECIDQYGLDGEWPAYEEVVHTIDLPVWAQR